MDRYEDKARKMATEVAAESARMGSGWLDTMAHEIIVFNIAHALRAERERTIQDMLNLCPACGGSGQYYHKMKNSADPDVAPCQWCDEMIRQLAGGKP